MRTELTTPSLRLLPDAPPQRDGHWSTRTQYLTLATARSAPAAAHTATQRATCTPAAQPNSGSTHCTHAQLHASLCCSTWPSTAASAPTLLRTARRRSLAATRGGSAVRQRNAATTQPSGCGAAQCVGCGRGRL